KDRIRWITIDEADKLIASSALHLRPLVIFLLYTGARVGEALWLDWRDVDLDRAHATFPKTKNGDARGVPLHPRVTASLKRLGHRDGGNIQSVQWESLCAHDGRWGSLRSEAHINY